MARWSRRTRGGSTGTLSPGVAIALLLVVGGGVLMLQGTGAFSTVVGDRPFNLGTADDQSAVLGIAVGSPSGQDGDRVDVLTLTNRLSERFDEVEVVAHPAADPSVSLEHIDTPRSLQPGQSRTVTAVLTCDASVTDVPVELDVSVSGPEGSITATREVRLTCEVKPDDGDDEHDKDKDKDEDEDRDGDEDEDGDHDDDDDEDSDDERGKGKGRDG